MVPPSIKMYPAAGMGGNTVSILKNLTANCSEDKTGPLDLW